MPIQNQLRSNAVANQLTRVLCLTYLLVLFYILVLKLGIRFSAAGERSVNLVPFQAPLIVNGKMDVGEMLLNVVVFVPLGIYAGVLFKNWAVGKKLFFFFAVSFLVEAIQYLLAVGAFDVTDLITNTSGGIIGLGLYTLLEKLFRCIVRAQKFINVMAVAGTVLLLVLLALLKLNMLPVRYQ